MKKRIFALLGVVFVLASALSVSAFAACSHNALTYGDTGDGMHYEYCNDCGYETKEPHTGSMVPYDDEYHLYSCEYCEYQEYLAHEGGYFVIVTPTCGMENGLATDLFCQFCGLYVNPYSISSPHSEHEYINGVCKNCNVTSTSGCEHQIINSFVSLGTLGHSILCSTCGEHINWEPHDMYSFVYAEATYDRQGVLRYSCHRCDYYYDELYSVEDHTCNKGAFVYLDELQHVTKCTICSKPFFGAHVWDNGKVTQQPSTESNGVRTFTCTVCDGTKTETIDYIDFEKLLETMTQKEATDFYKKIFEKYQAELVKDFDCMRPYVEEFVWVILDDIAEKGSGSQYYGQYRDYYDAIMLYVSSSSSDYMRGYNDAMASVIDSNPVQGLFQGIWASVLTFVTVVGNGVAIGGISLMSVLVTLCILLLVWFVVKLMKG